MCKKMTNRNACACAFALFNIHLGLNTSTLEAESYHSGYLPASSVTDASEVNTCHPCYSLEHLQIIITL